MGLKAGRLVEANEVLYIIPTCIRIYILHPLSLPQSTPRCKDSLGATLGTERTSASERPSFLASLPPRVRRQHILQAATQDENDPRVPITFLLALAASLLSLSLSSLSLLSRSRTTFTDTKPPPRGSRTPSFLSCFSLSFVCLHFLYPIPITGAPKITSTMVVYKAALLLVEEASHSNQKFLLTPLYLPVCSLFSLGERLCVTAVNVVSTDLSRNGEPL